MDISVSVDPLSLPTTSPRNSSLAHSTPDVGASGSSSEGSQVPDPVPHRHDILPLSSCFCERSASTLRCLNNYLRCTQKEERLSALGLIHTHYHVAIDVDIRKHPRIEWKQLVYFLCNFHSDSYVVMNVKIHWAENAPECTSDSQFFQNFHGGGMPPDPPSYGRALRGPSPKSLDETLTTCPKM